MKEIIEIASLPMARKKERRKLNTIKSNAMDIAAPI